MPFLSQAYELLVFAARETVSTDMSLRQETVSSLLSDGLQKGYKKGSTRQNVAIFEFTLGLFCQTMRLLFIQNKCNLQVCLVF